MTSAADAAGSPRTYGNWRRPSSAGLGSLGTLGTGVLLAGLIAVIAVIAVAGLYWALAVSALVAVALALLAVRDRHHRTGVQRLATRIGWWRAGRSGARTYR